MNQENKLDISKLSKQAQQKLEEIRKQHNFQTIKEAADYMINFTKQK